MLDLKNIKVLKLKKRWNVKDVNSNIFDISIKINSVDNNIFDS